MDLFKDLANGGKLDSINRICDLIGIDFLVKEETVCIHVECALVRFFCGKRLVGSSYDMFIPGKNYKADDDSTFEWDIPGNNLFDEQVACFIKEMENQKVRSVSFTGKDLIIDLENDCKIEILSNTLEEDREIFRIFKKDDDLDTDFVVDT